MTTSGGTADSIVGQYGTMPIDMLLRKQEQTCMYESPYLVENNLRELLVDFKPDKPFLESDQLRGGVDKYGVPRGGYESTSRINLRSGARTLTDPYLTDGTFLDYQFLESDPRGVATEPDMKKYANQEWARKDLIMQFPDSDKSVPESGWNPWSAQMQIRNAQNVTQNYFKIFDTAKDGWTNGGMAPGYAKSCKEKYVPGQVVKDPAQIPNRNRINATTSLSNDTSIGWRRTTDNKFQVSRYASPYALKSFTKENWYKNRSNTHIDHDIYTNWQGNNMLKATALTMMDLAKNREMYQFTGLNGIEFPESMRLGNKKVKLTPSDIAGYDKYQTKETRASDANESLKGEQTPLKSNKTNPENKVIEQTHINPTIVEHMSNINIQTIKNKNDDLRKKIKKSADDMGIYLEKNTKQTKKTFDPSSMWNSINYYHKGKSINALNYKMAVAKIEEGGKKIEKVSVEPRTFVNSRIGKQRRGKLEINSNANVNTSEIDNDYGREVSRSHLVGPLGSKYLNMHMECDTEHNNINDSDKRCGI